MWKIMKYIYILILAVFISPLILPNRAIPSQVQSSDLVNRKSNILLKKNDVDNFFDFFLASLVASNIALSWHEFSLFDRSMKGFLISCVDSVAQFTVAITLCLVFKKITLHEDRAKSETSC